MASGIEMALKSMGLGSVIDAAKELAENGSVQRIIAFAEGLEKLNNDVAQIKRALGISDGDGQTAALEFRPAADEPGSDAAHRDA